MAFTHRKIDLTFRLGKSGDGVPYNFSGGDFDTVKVSGLRVKADVRIAMPPASGTATVRIYGLTLSLMNQLAPRIATAAGGVVTRWNNLQIDAGDDNGMTTVFQGNIVLAPIDMNNPPDSCLIITAQGGYFEAIKKTAPSSYPGNADVADIMSILAGRNGYAFENNGVSVILNTPYLPGTPRDQMQRAAQAANINWVLDNGTLAIWSKDGLRAGTIPLVSVASGMVGYPTNFDIGVDVRTVFDQRLKIGQACEIQSDLKFANGRFVMYDISHSLESETQNGEWFTKFHGTPINGR